MQRARNDSERGAQEWASRRRQQVASVSRSQSLRAFDKEGMLRTAVIASHEEMADTIEALFADDEVAYIQAYNLAYGCFMAQVERD